MIINYKEVDSFEVVAEDACQEITAHKYLSNYVLAYQITKENLFKNKLLDVEQEAKNWALEERPNHHFFSHGEYRVGGLNYIADELKRKPTSNRALYSLINQTDITDSGDKPIPSFMVFQCLLDEDNKDLFVTVYFRALEISTFLRVNLEEIRQNLVHIYEQSISFERVKLLLIAGRAHHSPGQLPLKRPEIDVLTPYQLIRKLQDSPSELRDLIVEKAQTQSVICYESLEIIKEFLEEEGKMPLMINEVKKSIELSQELERYRKEGSHSTRIMEATEALKETLLALAERFLDE